MYDRYYAVTVLLLVPNIQLLLYAIRSFLALFSMLLYNPYRKAKVNYH